MKYILVCRIDYFHETANLRYWFRVLGNVKSMDTIKEIVGEMGGRIQDIDDRATLINALECDRLCCGIQRGDRFAAVSFEREVVHDAVTAYDVLEEIQDRLLQESVNLKYIPCQYAHENSFCDEMEDDEVMVWTPQITKEMVVEAAKNEKVFAPKATRHLIPARPLNANIPLTWFREDVSLREINHRVSQYLEGKKIKRFGPGQVIDGRYYEEELFVFFDKKER
jgi:hypothetical protein